VKIIEVSTLWLEFLRLLKISQLPNLASPCIRSSSFEDFRRTEFCNTAIETQLLSRSQGPWTLRYHVRYYRPLAFRTHLLQRRVHRFAPRRCDRRESRRNPTQDSKLAFIRFHCTLADISREPTRNQKWTKSKLR